MKKRRKSFSLGTHSFFLKSGLLFWVLLMTVLRAVRRPNDWAEVHWLVDYRFGFIKRGLTGFLFSKICGDAVAPELAILLVSSALLMLFLFVVWLFSVRIWIRTGRQEDVLVVLFLFLSSPYFVMAGHLNGYFDNILIMLTMMGIFWTLRGCMLAVNLVLGLGILVHESILIMGFPAIFLARHYALMGDAPLNRRAWTQYLLNMLTPFLLPVGLFLFLFVYQMVFLDKIELTQMLTAYMKEFPFVAANADTIVPEAFAPDFVAYYRTQSPWFFRRLFSPRYLISMMPTICCMSVCVLRIYRARLNAYSNFLLAAVCFSPLLMHAGAWDVARLWTYPIISSFLCMWILTEVLDAPQTALAGRKTYMLSALAFLMLNIFVRMPLMDDRQERFSGLVRLFLYGPVIIYFLCMTIRMFQRDRQQSKMEPRIDANKHKYKGKKH
jgi:hypothetical protein